MFIPNQWYALLESSQVKTGQARSFKRLGQELVFWRNEAGEMSVMEDRCPHRQVKLSLGKVKDGCIECPFHGFQYDQQGDCRLIPANGKNGPRPQIFKVKTYPVQEAHGFIWVWNGEERPEYPPVPYFEGLEEFKYSTLRKQWPVHYTRAIENQLDVAHLPFVHGDTIGRGGQTLVNGPFTLLEDGALYVWIDNQKDQGNQAVRGSELTRPVTPWQLCFKFPNVWQLNISAQLKMVVAFAPVDDENTFMYVRLHQSFVKHRLIGQLVAELGSLSNVRVLNQDKRVVSSHRPKEGGLDSGDKYIPADRPMLFYYRERERLLKAGQSQESGLPGVTVPVVRYSEKSRAV